MEEVKTIELIDFLLKHLKGERELKTRSINYYNSVIRFIYDVVLDIPINQKQIPMLKGKRRLPKILSREELNVFFDACENYKYKTIFMLIYGTGLRISETTNLRIEDVDSKDMSIFVRNGKGERERYTVLLKISLEMLRKYYQMYKLKHPERYMFLNEDGKPLTVERLRVFFRRYKRKAKISEEFIVHSLIHSFETKLVEGVPLVQVKELLGHSCINGRNANNNKKIWKRI